MLKTYCFIYRKWYHEKPITVFVKAKSEADAVRKVRESYRTALTSCWYCLPARRNAIHEALSLMEQDYKEVCGL